MSGIHLGWNPVDELLESLRVLLEELRREVSELRAENAELRQQVSSLKCDVGYLCAGRDSQPRCSGIALWKSGQGLLVVDRYSAYKAMAQVNLSERWSA